MKEYASDVTSYYWKKFECEICKQPYPYIFKSKDNLFKLIDNMQPLLPAGITIPLSYLLLES